MSNQSIHADFLAARAKTTALVMNATGWQQGQVNPESVGIDSVFFYVLDHQTQWLWCCSIPKFSFYQAVEELGRLEPDDTIAFCAQTLKKSAALNGLNADQEYELSTALIAYISITGTYRLAECAKKQNHFVVIRYGATDTLRPFAMGGPAQYLMGAQMVRAAMQQVVSLDAKNHPEWLAKSTTMPPGGTGFL